MLLTVSLVKRGMPHKEASGLVKRQKQEGEKIIGQNLYHVFPRKGKARRGGNNLGLTSLNNVGGLWALGVISSAIWFWL